MIISLVLVLDLFVDLSLKRVQDNSSMNLYKFATQLQISVRELILYGQDPGCIRGDNH